jgi:molecular chaperone DnaK
VYQTEKFLSENKEKVDTLAEDVRTEVDAALAEAKKALEGADDAAIKSSSERLQTAFQALGAAIYASAQPSAADAAGDTAGDTGSATGDSGADEDVVEAEIVDEEKDDK